MQSAVNCLYGGQGQLKHPFIIWKICVEPSYEMRYDTFSAQSLAVISPDGQGVSMFKK